MDYSGIGAYSISFEMNGEISFNFPIISNNYDEFKTHLEDLAYRKIFFIIDNFEALLDSHLRDMSEDRVFTIPDYFENLRKEKNETEL